MRKISLIICLLIGSLFANVLFAQSKVINFPAKTMTISQAFKVIESQSGLSIAYNEELLDVSKVVSTPSGKLPAEILPIILRGTNTEAVFQGKIIIIRKLSEPKGEVMNYSGIVKDKIGPVPGAYVLIAGTQNGTMTDANGKFSISAKKGDVLNITMLGYKPSTMVLGSQSSGISILLFR
jgi:hypothetical protein